MYQVINCKTGRVMGETDNYSDAALLVQRLYSEDYYHYHDYDSKYEIQKV